MKPINESRFDNTIITIKTIGKKYLLTSDSLATIRYLDINTLEIKNQLKSNAIQDSYLNNVVDFSFDAKYLALISSGAKESKLYNLKEKKLIGMVSRHQGGVSCIAIDPKNRYMFSGGDDGITFGVDIKSGQLAFTLPRHTDSINDIAFSKNGNLVATASYDRNISIFNLMSMTSINKLKAHSEPVLKLQFLNRGRLISIDKRGSAIVWNIGTSEIITRLQGIHDDVTKVTIDNDEKFLFIGTKLGYILVYNLDSYEQISRRYIKFENAITALSFDDVNKSLLIGTQGGWLFIYNIFQYENHIHEAITYEKYALIDGCIDKNPLLAHTDIYKKFESLWEKTLQKAKELIENSEKEKAMELFKNFKEIPSRKQLMEKLFIKYKDYDKFLTLVKQNKLALVYAMANSNPHFKETKAFKYIELQWKKSVALAQKYLSTPHNEDKVKEVFAPYRGISEKTVMIQDLLTNSMIYNRFKNFIANREFKMVFELTKKHPFLKESAEYTAVINYADVLYIQAAEFQKDGDTHSAIKNYQILLDFEDFKTEAKEILKKLEDQQKFFLALQNDDIVLAYTTLDSLDELQVTSEGKKLQKLWEDSYEKAGDFAANADIEGIKKCLVKYINIKSKHMAIATLISWCYITELNNGLKNKIDQKIIENGIKNFILYFGLTDQITTYFIAFQKEYPNTKLNLESQTNGSIANWKPSMIVKSILD